ncbi:glycosyl hydrolase [Flavihumibacter sp. UBA7668]|uniref:glycosyl hydrolase n=1 Tax=Flavihumibacter sp. UBA7668 TaxID=1946542 RepID=UPI0025BC1F09|nr:glycosyl hydrolase [Flavihumibacter sp. UBA7668]
MSKKITSRFSLVGCLLALLLGWFSGAAQSPGSPCDNRATYLYWVGGSSTDFFDESNWREGKRKVQQSDSSITRCGPGVSTKFFVCRGDEHPLTDKIPVAGTLQPGQPIPFNMVISGVAVQLTAPLVFSCLDKGLTLDNAQLQVGAGLSGTLHLSNESTVRVQGANFPTGLRISLEDHGSWVYFDQLNPLETVALPLSSWMVRLAVPGSASELLMNQYYQKGSVVRINPAAFRPLEVFSQSGFEGSAATVGVNTIYSAGSIPGGLNNAIRSFKLKRGFMATLAVNGNGTGKSQVFIASEKDLDLADLPLSLSGEVSFIRVLPWNWVAKKGTGGKIQNNPLDAGWYYNWGLGELSNGNYEYVPMAWGAGGTAPNNIQLLIDKPSTTHLLGFNESDNCEDQSGQFNNLCDPATAVAYYERLMQTGYRLGTPAPRENGPSTWLREFARIAKERDVRFDFLALHWYDWGSSPANSPNANPQEVFNRFKAYLQRVHDEYQLPIWITEFNANPNRENSVNAAFLELALPFLDTLSYVERYAYFEPNPAYGSNTVAPSNYFDATGAITNIGQIYRDHVAAASMTDSALVSPNNLSAMNQPLPVFQEQQFVYEVECGSFPGNRWTVGEASTASNGKFLKGNLAVAAGSSLSSQVHFDFEVAEENNFRIWVRTRQNGAMAIQVNHDRVDSVVALTNTTFAWQSFPRLYRFKAGKNRVSLGFVNGVTEFDQIAFIAGSEDVGEPSKPAGYCDTVPFVWGAAGTGDPVFAEAEAAVAGANWTVETNSTAIGGQFISSSAVSVDAAPDEAGQLRFSVDVSASGAYQFWAKIQHKEEGANKLWWKKGTDSFTSWSVGVQPDFEWKWVRYDPALLGENVQNYLFLEEGSHEFTLAYASGGVKIDRVALMPAGQSPASIDPDVILQSGPQSFEAEEAQLLTGSLIVACATSSNGEMVNMGRLATGGVRFSEVNVSKAGTYRLTVHYMSAVQRSLRVLVNGSPVFYSFAASGPWCFNGGSPTTRVLTITLIAGPNTIEIRPVAGSDAPFIDRIDIEEPVELTVLPSAGIRSDALAEKDMNTGSLYPNPARAGSIVYIPGLENARVSLLDLSGRLLERRVINNGTGYRLPMLKKGVYMVRVDQQGMVKVYRLIIGTE